MEMRLAENIRAFRRERKLTQEQLAEVLGVTAGAVYKWEAKLSLPDLELIVSMADLFDTSVDVLLGYEIKDNRLEATIKRLRECRRNKDVSGLEDAEKALKKYPYSFRIVNECAATYRAFGFEHSDKGMLRRALELLEQSLLLLPQNEDPEISEQTIYGKIAETYFGLDENDKAAELMKKHNAGGMYNHRIGQVLSQSDRFAEAVPYLSESMAQLIAALINTILGYMNVYLKSGDYASGCGILDWGVSLMQGLREGNKPNFLDKVSSALLVPQAFTQLQLGQSDKARGTLMKAKALAAFFDSAPSYDESDIRFITRIEGASANDDMGATAADAVLHALESCECEELTAIWKSINEQEDK